MRNKAKKSKPGWLSRYLFGPGKISRFDPAPFDNLMAKIENLSKETFLTSLEKHTQQNIKAGEAMTSLKKIIAENKRLKKQLKKA